MPHPWTFKKHFRRQAYSWNGTALASKRMKEAVSEIKKVARKDSSLAGEGVVELFYRLYPALMQIDSSSGALGTAMYHTLESLIPILIQADWNMNTRGKWLENLYEAIGEDGWGTFDNLRKQWGEICVYPGLAHLWADRLIPDAQHVLSSEGSTYTVATDMCLSCLLFTERYQELYDLLQLQKNFFWLYNEFWAKALVKQGKLEQALSYAQQILAEDRTHNDKIPIDLFCESTLIQMGRIEEAYEKYGLRFSSYGSNLNIYRKICEKYPTIDREKILLDCINKTGEKGKWFAAAKEEGHWKLAVQCALSSSSDPDTLIRACRDYADTNFPFALVVGVLGIVRLLTGTFYDDVTGLDVAHAYNQVEKVALDKGKLDDFRFLLHREIGRQYHSCKPGLRDPVLRRLESKGI
jgi:tetratricopeptide (TPR) repeat protein